MAAALAIVGTLMVYMHSSHDDENDLRAYFPSRQLRPHHPKFINPSYTDPKNVRSKEDIAPSFISNIAPKESAVLNPLSDINAWGTPAKLTSFGYKWRDDKCSNADNEVQPKKKRAALALYGGISAYQNLSNVQQTKKYIFDGSRTVDISNLSNVDWAAALYDKNLLPEGDFELDIFIHNWSETYFCSIAKSFDGTRFTVRSIIAESNEKHMNELFPMIREVTPNHNLSLIQASMYFSINKALALALDYSTNCGFEYDLLMAARPDVLLGEPLSFHDKNGKKTKLHEVLAPNNVVLHSYIRNARGRFFPAGDFHYIFNAATARTFVGKMFPPPDQKWPEIAKLRTSIYAHSGFVQEFGRNNGIVMSNDGIVGPSHEEIIRRIRYQEDWKDKMDFLGLPEYCFPSPTDGWQTHIDSNDPQCFPRYFEAQGSCPPNQNRHTSDENNLRDSSLRRKL